MLVRALVTATLALGGTMAHAQQVENGTVSGALWSVGEAVAPGAAIVFSHLVLQKHPIVTQVCQSLPGGHLQWSSPELSEDEHVTLVIPDVWCQSFAPGIAISGSQIGFHNPDPASASFVMVSRLFSKK